MVAFNRAISHTSVHHDAVEVELGERVIGDERIGRKLKAVWRCKTSTYASKDVSTPEVVDIKAIDALALYCVAGEVETNAANAEALNTAQKTINLGEQADVL